VVDIETARHVAKKCGVPTQQWGDGSRRLDGFPHWHTARCFPYSYDPGYSVGQRPRDPRMSSYSMTGHTTSAVDGSAAGC
jgi:hypothetical protein